MGVRAAFASVLLLITVLLLPGCKAVKKLTQFSLKFNQTIIIPSTVGINLPFNINTPPMATNSVAEFERNNTNSSLVERIELRQLRLKLTAPSNSDFSFLNSVKIFLSADGLPETLVAWRENIPDNVGKELDLQTTNADLKAYVMKERISLRVSTVTDKLIASEHHIDLEATFFVDARLLGL